MRKINLSLNHFWEMALAMRHNESAGPANVGIFNSLAVMSLADFLAHTIEQPWFLGQRRRRLNKEGIPAL
jgi:hypothetical protein